MTSIPRPDLSARPLRVSCEHSIRAAPGAVLDAWTVRFDAGFAQAGTLALVAEAIEGEAANA